MAKEVLVRDKVTDQYRLHSGINIEYAGFWVRVGAALIDLVVWYILFMALLVAVMISLDVLFNILISQSGLEFVLYFIIILLFATFEGRGASPGKYLLGLRVVDQEGYVIGFPGGIIRMLLKCFSLAIFGFGLLSIGWDPKKQGLHDKILNTYVVYVE